MVNSSSRISSPGWVAIFGLILTLAIAALHLNPIYFAVGPITVLWIYDVTQIIVALTGAAIALLMWWAFERGEILKTIWGALGLGLLLWTFGEVLWSYYQLVLHEDLPSPSLADAFWLVGYVPVLVGLFLRWHTLRAAPRSAWRLAVLGIYLALVVLALVYVLKPILDNPDPEKPIVTVINALYPIGDLLVALGALLILLALVQGSMGGPWVIVVTGYLMVAASDLLFAYGTWSGSYPDDPATGVTVVMFVTNVLYFASYVAAAVGFYGLARQHRILRA